MKVAGRKAVGGVALVGALSAFLIGLSVAAFVVVRVAERDMLLRRAFLASVAIENSLHRLRPPTPEAIRDMVEGFDAEGISYLAVIGPGRVTWAHTDTGRIGEPVNDARLEAAFATLEVQSGFSADESGKEVFDVFIPLRRGRGPGPPWLRPDRPPLPGFGPGEIVVRLGVTAEVSSWLDNWVWAQAAASIAVTAMLWWGLFRTRGVGVRLAAMEDERRRREVLARLGEVSAVLAHEVRNPLAATKGHLQLALERLPAAPGVADARARIGVALDEVGRIEVLMRGLLDYARERPLSPAPADAAELASRAVDLAGARLPAPRVEVRSTGDTGLTVDPDQVVRALANIIENAKEAAGGAGEVVVTVEGAGAGVRWSVEDSGPGVSAELVQRVFDPFVTGKVRGVGLGLAVARQVVEAHGGQVVAGRSVVLGGARFDMVIPRQSR